MKKFARIKYEFVEIDYQIRRARGTTTTDVTTESNNSEDKLKA